MYKELALALDFENAPESLKTAARNSMDSWIRAEKAKAQVARWNAEVIESNKSFAENHKNFKSELDAWDPADKKNPGLEEKGGGRP